ncbi:hypothetical protein ACWDRB_36915 [Nonomuraea sp. NPDC003707]
MRRRIGSATDPVEPIVERDHGKETAHTRETSTRLNLIAAWREAKVFTEAEQAALELTEQGTRTPAPTRVLSSPPASRAR